MNDDVIVTPNWLVALMRHLEDRSVGLVGPVTNAAPNEARVETHYGTYRELVDEAAERRVDRCGESFDIGVATMFCVAFRREVYDQVGGLDEEFGLGLFEDDDYSRRVVDAGYRVVCADDVLVHHFGEASFGRLAATGEYAAQLRENQARFEAKWGTQWTPHERRPSPEYDDLKESIRRFAREAGLPWSDVLVVANGDDDLLELDGVTARHFPQDGEGRYRGHHPADGAEAVRHLEALRREGARFVLFPRTATWWLDHYRALHDHLAVHATEVPGPDGCRVFQLDRAGATVRSPSRVGSRSA
jgi:hypothetical protein